MSFRDLESGPKGGGHASKQQPKQRKDEDSAIERSIKANIQEMQDNIRDASEQLDRAQRNYLSKRMTESLDKSLERSRELSQQTEHLLRDWFVQFAGEPSERHRKKFSYEKLHKAFDQELMHLKEVARRAVVAQQEAAAQDARLSNSNNMGNMVEEQSSTTCGDESEQGLLDDTDTNLVSRSSMQEDMTIRNRIAQEREEGIKRIQSQVCEVNQIFRDLATIVQEQGKQFESIEQNAEQASTSTKQAVQELRKTVERQRGARERLCCMLFAGFLLLCFVILPHMHLFEIHHSAGPGTQSGFPSSVASPTPSPPTPQGFEVISKTGHVVT